MLSLKYFIPFTQFLLTAALRPLDKLQKITKKPPDFRQAHFYDWLFDMF